MSINITIVDRFTGAVKTVQTSLEWEIAVDAISPTTSRFTIHNQLNRLPIDEGDWVIAKFDNNILRSTSVSISGLSTALYYGLVDSYNYGDGGDHVLSVRQDTSLFNLDMVLTRSTVNETHPSIYIQSIFTRMQTHVGLGIDNVELMPIPREIEWGMYSEGLEIHNIENIVSGLFRSTQTITEVVGFRLEDNNVRFRFNSTRKSLPKAVANDTDMAKIFDMDIYIRPSNVGMPNAIEMLNVGTNPATWQTFFMRNDGTVSSVFDQGLMRTPISLSSHIYDPTTFEPPIPSPFAIALGILREQTYNHEITFRTPMSRDSQMYMELGRDISIRHDGKVYDSIITGFEINSSKSVVKIKCGNIRSTMHAFLNEL